MRKCKTFFKGVAVIATCMMLALAGCNNTANSAGSSEGSGSGSASGGGGTTPPVVTLEKITTTPEKLEFNKEKDIDGKDATTLTELIKNNITVVAHYSDASTKDVSTYTVDVSSLDADITIEQDITIKYESKTCVVKVTVSERVLEKITTPIGSAIVLYGKDISGKSEIDIAQLIKSRITKVTALYNNGETEVLKSDDYTVESFDKTKYGEEQTVIIKYGEKTTTRKVKFEKSQFKNFTVDEVTITEGVSKEFKITTDPSDGVIFEVTSDDIVETTADGNIVKLKAKKKGATSIKLTAKKDGYEDKEVTVAIKVLPIELKSIPTVGSIIMKDGSLKTADTIAEADKANAIAVVYKVDSENKKAWAIGKEQKEGGLAWCTKSASAYNKNIKDLETTITASAAGVKFDGYIDGSTGWGKLAGTSYITDTTTETNYPAWYWCKDYGTTNCRETDFTNGWYFPSIAELLDICNEKTTVNTALEKSGGKKVISIYWSSSKTNSIGKTAYLLDFSRDIDKGNWSNNTDYSAEFPVCAVRQFTY